MNAYHGARYAGGGPPQIRFGVSIERQREADERLQALSAIERFTVTVYPVLGPIDLSRWLNRIDIVAAGQEIERPADPEWFEQLSAQCAAAGVRFIQSSRLVGEITESRRQKLTAFLRSAAA